MINDNVYKYYGLGMRLIGYDRSIATLVKKLDLDCPPEAKILDAGCGTGAMGLSLAKKFQKSTLLATDIDPRLLQLVTARAKKGRLDPSRISVGFSNITTPHRVSLSNRPLISLEQGTFDIVSSGACIGHSDNTENTIKILLSLVKPGGYFISLEMNHHFIGRYIAAKFSYPRLDLAHMKSLIESEGFSAELIPLTLKHFPANLTRVFLIARKK